MSEQNAPWSYVDPAILARTLHDIAGKSQNIVQDFLERQQKSGSIPDFDPLNLGGAFFEMTARMMSDPSKLMQAHVNLWNDYMTLWQTAAQRMMGQEVDPVARPDRGDRRFRDEAWEENQIFDFIKQSYLLSARWMQTTVNDIEGLDDKTAQKVDFYTRQFVDALAPSNFVMTNPEVLRTTVETKGENLLKGLHNLLDDLGQGSGDLRIRMTDHEAFAENLPEDLRANVAFFDRKRLSGP